MKIMLRDVRQMVREALRQSDTDAYEKDLIRRYADEFDLLAVIRPKARHAGAWKRNYSHLCLSFDDGYFTASVRDKPTGFFRPLKLPASKIELAIANHEPFDHG